METTISGPVSCLLRMPPFTHRPHALRVGALELAPDTVANLARARENWQERRRHQEPLPADHNEGYRPQMDRLGPGAAGGDGGANAYRAARWAVGWDLCR